MLQVDNVKRTLLTFHRDQTGANGANLSFPQEFGLVNGERDEWIVGLINSIIFLTAGLIGAFIVDPLNK